jgi:hypothetical protein
LLLSITSVLWEQRWNLKYERKILPLLADQSYKDRESTILSHTHPFDERPKTYAVPVLSKIFRLFGQPSMAAVPLNFVQLQSLNDFLNKRYDEEQSTPYYRYLSAYKGFPYDRKDSTPLFSWSFDFWELKIPRKLSMEDLEMVQVRLMPDELTVYDRKLNRVFESKNIGYRVEKTTRQWTYHILQHSTPDTVDQH